MKLTQWICNFLAFSFWSFLPCLQRVKKVIGIEMCQEAVQDAKVNAELNGRLHFYCLKGAWRSLQKLKHNFYVIEGWFVKGSIILTGHLSVGFWRSKKRWVSLWKSWGCVSQHPQCRCVTQRHSYCGSTKGRPAWVPTNQNVKSTSFKMVLLNDVFLKQTQRWSLPSEEQSIWRDSFTWHVTPRQPWPTSLSEPYQCGCFYSFKQQMQEWFFHTTIH